MGECPPPPPALLTQDSMPRERRHLAGGTREGGFGLVFLFVLSIQCSLGAHGLLRFRTNNVLLGTSGVGVCVSVVSNSLGMLYRFRTGVLLHHLSLSCWEPSRQGERSPARNLIDPYIYIYSHLSGLNFALGAWARDWRALALTQVHQRDKNSVRPCFSCDRAPPRARAL